VAQSASSRGEVVSDALGEIAVGTGSSQHVAVLGAEEVMSLLVYDRIVKALVGLVVGCILTFMMDGAAAQSTQPWTQREDDLRVALQHPDQAKIRALVDAGANLNARDVLGGTALHVAVNFRGDIEVIRLLIDRGANINALNDDGYTPLLLALRHAHYNHSDPGRLKAVVDLLLSRGASATLSGKDGMLPVRAAMDPVNIALIRLLLEHGAAMPDDGLDWALSNKRVDLIKLLLERPTPAILAYRDVHGGTMLHRAAEGPQMLFAIEWLVRNGADLHAKDHDGVTPFGRAAFSGNVSAMEYLYRHKAGAMHADKHGQTPLHLAAYGARHDIMGWLIKRGADLKAKDGWGRTPLEIAIDTHRFAFYDEERKSQLVSLLGGAAADILRGRYARDPLNEATERRDIKEVRRLLEAGANPNAKNASGHTPLYWALALCSGLPATPAERAFGKELLPLLIRHGANPEMRMGDGSTERTYAEYARVLRVDDLLETAMRRYAPKGASKPRQPRR
jgi:ankyrin repeat protein